MKKRICEYSYAPERDMAKSIVLVGGCFASAAGMLAVSVLGGVLAPYFRIAAPVWVLAGILFANRFLSTRYVYSVFRDDDGGRELTVNEVRFGVSRTVCRISLYDIKEIRVYDPVAEIEVARREGRRKIGRIKRPRPDRKAHGRARSFNYCVDVFPSKYCLIFTFDGNGAYVKFSPDERMIGVMHNCVLTERGFNGII